MKGYRRLHKGFTLVELMIVITIVGILATIAYPSYSDYVRKSRRQDAINALKAVQLAQERWRASHTAYGTLSELGLPATTEGGHYTIAVTLPAAPANQTQYSATAAAVTGKGQDKDKAQGISCASLQVNQDKAVYTPAGQSACWGR